MESKAANISAIQNINLAPGETVLFQGSPNTTTGLWHCYRFLFNLTWFLYLLGGAVAYLRYHVPVHWLVISSGAYLVLLYILSAIDAYTDRDVYFCLTNQRVIKLKGGKINKQLLYDEVTNVTHKEKDGQGYFVFTGGEGGMTAISLLGIDRVSAVYAALPQEVKKIADDSNKSILQ